MENERLRQGNCREGIGKGEEKKGGIERGRGKGRWSGEGEGERRKGRWTPDAYENTLEERTWVDPVSINFSLLLGFLLYCSVSPLFFPFLSLYCWNGPSSLQFFVFFSPFVHVCEYIHTLYIHVCVCVSISI